MLGFFIPKNIILSPLSLANLTLSAFSTWPHIDYFTSFLLFIKNKKTALKEHRCY